MHAFSLSKTTFMYGCQCPKRLYLYKRHRHLMNPVDEQQQALFSAGTDIGKIARTLFPGGLDVTPPNPFQYSESARLTQVALQTHFVIYEATFIHAGIMCAVDMLVRKGNHWYAFEVKNSNSVKPQHIADAALQYAVITGAGIELEDFSIVHLNRDYLRIGPLDIHQLFTQVSVLTAVQAQQEEVATRALEFQHLLQSPSIPEIPVGDHCAKPYPCDFTQYCWGEHEAPPEEQHTIIVQKENVSTFIEQVQYPIAFLDFETVMYGIPEFSYSRPWQQIPFQYSLHIQQSPSGDLLHKEFIGDGMQDPRPGLLEKLLHDLGPTGTILVYNQTFELGRLQELALFMPQHAPALKNIMERIVDLMVPFKKGHVQATQTGGSNSIKHILPALCPEFSYEQLAIQDGQTASFTYSQLREMKEMDRFFALRDLSAYCTLDTLAMVKIWEWLNQNVR